GETRFGLRPEAGALLLDRGPVGRIREEVGERDDRVAFGLERRDDPLLRLVEPRAVVGQATPARAVREDAIVELVGGPDAPPLERRGDMVDPRREVRLRPMHDRSYATPRRRVL